MPVLLSPNLQAVIGSPIRVPNTDPEFSPNSNLCSGEFYFPAEDSFSDPCSAECDVPGYPGLTVNYWFNSVIEESQYELTITVMLSVHRGSKGKPFLLTTHSFKSEVIDPDYLLSLRQALESTAVLAFDTTQWIANNPFGPDPVVCGEVKLTNPQSVNSYHIREFAKYIASKADEDWQHYPLQPFTSCFTCSTNSAVKCATGEDQFSYSLNGLIEFIGKETTETIAYSGTFSPWYNLPCDEISGYYEDLVEQIISRDYHGSILEYLQSLGWQILTGPPNYTATTTIGRSVQVSFNDTVQTTFILPNGDESTISDEVRFTLTVTATCNCDNESSDPPPDPTDPWRDPERPCAGEPMWKVFCPSGIHFTGSFEATIRKKSDPTQVKTWRMGSSPQMISVAGGCNGVPWGLQKENYTFKFRDGPNGSGDYKAGLHLEYSTRQVNWTFPSKAFTDPIWWGFWYIYYTNIRLVGVLDPEWEWVGTPYGVFTPGYLSGTTTIVYQDCDGNPVGVDITQQTESAPESEQPVPPPPEPPPPGIPCKQYVVTAKISMGIGSHLKKKFLDEVEQALRARAKRAGKIIGNSRSPFDQQVWEAFEFIVDRVVDALSLSVTLASYQIPLICTWYVASDLEMFLINQLIDILISWPSATITAPLSIKLSAEIDVLPEECICTPP